MECESDSAVLWEHRFEDLRQWKKLHGDCNVPKAEGKLGRWVVRQRELHKKSKLEPERQQKLDRLGFVWNTNEAAWEHKYALLVKYKETHNHCCVPISDSTLGMWVAKMRANRRRNKLAQHRIDKLNAIKFVWNTAEEDWMDKYNRLLDFRATNGHSCVPFNEGELGWWVNTQRQNKRKGKLVPHREALLNEAHFVWAPQEFLAARRRQQAAARANSAHRLATTTAAAVSNGSYYRSQTHSTSPYGKNEDEMANANYLHQYSHNQVRHSPIAPPQGYISNPPKRRYVPYLETPSASLSPTSVKRLKVTGTESSSNNNNNENCTSASAVPQSVPSTQVMQVTDWTSHFPKPIVPSLENMYSPAKPGVKQEEKRPDVRSIASLLSPSPQQHSPISVMVSPECSGGAHGRERSKFMESTVASSSVLSSICGIPRINACSPRSTGEMGHGFVLPPITTLRGFQQAKTADRKT